jgi:hypothetical protein
MMALLSNIRHQLHSKQGAALLLMLLILILGAASFFVSSLNSLTVQTARDNKTTLSLAQAKDALIGDSVSTPLLESAGYLRLPDLGFGLGNVPSEGSSPPNFSGNDIDHSVIGKIPWKTLGISPSQDGQGECIWYAVSGRFKNNPTTNSSFNWDTPGQIDVIDGKGNTVASNVAALIIAPGKPLDRQDRAISNPAYTQCGGNYDVRNYLDPYINSDDNSSAVNYFPGSTNNRVALNSKNIKFVSAIDQHHNDRFLFLTVDDIFRPIIRRNDFAVKIAALINDSYFQAAMPVSSNKGIVSNICGSLLSDNQTFCNNWKEMLLFARLPTPTSIIVDGVQTPACKRILIFGGLKTDTQQRLTTADKSNPANYLEGTNLFAFSAPTAVSGNFSGYSTFNANNPSADLIRCIQ